MEKKVPVRRLHFTEADKEAVGAETLAELAHAVDSRLYLQTESMTCALSGAALRDMFKVLQIRGAALRRLTDRDLRLVLNKCAKVSDRVVILTISDDVVVAAEAAGKGVM